MEKTVRQCFEFGFEEMRCKRTSDSHKWTMRREDFDTPMNKRFLDYPVGKYEEEFWCIVSFS